MTALQVSEGIYYFNFIDFMKKQKSIMKKYELSNNFVFESFDRYISQINEELEEVLASENEEEILEEIIDVLMYTGSTLAYAHGDKKFEMNLIIRKNDLNINLDTFIKDIFMKVIRIRRLFPERKWHKPHIDPRQEIYDNIGCNREVFTINLLKGIISDILEYIISNYNIEIFNSLLNKKQNYILDL